MCTCKEIILLRTVYLFERHLHTHSRSSQLKEGRVSLREIVKCRILDMNDKSTNINESNDYGQLTNVENGNDASDSYDSRHDDKIYSSC